MPLPFPFHTHTLKIKSMKKNLIVLLLLSAMPLGLWAQVVSWLPLFPTTDGSVSILFDARQGSAGLVGKSPVFIHIGVVTSGPTGTTWTRTVDNWGTFDARTLMTSLGNNQWLYNIPNVRSFFGIPAGTNGYRLAMVFRDSTGNFTGKTATGGDIFIPLFQNTNLALQFLTPDTRPATADSGVTINFAAATNKLASLQVYVNNNMVLSRNDSQINYALVNAAPGTGWVKITASDGNSLVKDSIAYNIRPPVTVQGLPAGLHNGVNYISDSSVILVLHAPNKTNAFAVGDFSNWQTDNKYFMKQTPDLRKFWIQINHLTPGAEFRYQYFVNGNQTVADAYCEKILDPSNDQYISTATYPEPKAYPNGKTTGIVSVFQTRQPVYSWRHTNFTPPAHTDLIIYECLVRDFTAKANFKTLTDTLPYLKKLGINCLQVMPVGEFEGNNSWGYNPNFHAALDKAYGTRTAFKALVDSAHALGIAVVMDIVNHAMGSSPLAQMYWDGANSRPAANSPFFNAIATHPFNVGCDFNHRSPDTREYIDYVNTYWLKEFHIDGYRFDLSKGFTQTNSGTNVGTWGNYDSTRINNLKRIQNVLKAANPNAYMILEHFAANSEETILANANMMPWGNECYMFNQLTMGYTTNSDISAHSYRQRGWTVPNLVGYMESHDEERMMFNNEQNGAVAGAYRIKDTTTALQRQKAAFVLHLLTPGPKMIYEFGELGFDLALNRCTNGTINNNCRTDPKPAKWNYLQVPARYSLFKTVSALMDLKKKDPSMKSGIFNLSTGTANCRRVWATSPQGNLMAVANFGLTNSTFTPGFPVNGKWYDYFTGDSLNVASAQQTVTLGIGEWHVYTTIKYARPDMTPLGTEPDVEPSFTGSLMAIPNPSEGFTRFRFSLPAAAQAELRISNLLGQTISILNAGSPGNGSNGNTLLPAGENSLVWDGTDAQGKPAAPGIYIAELIAGSNRQSTKVVISR